MSLLERTKVWLADKAERSVMDRIENSHDFWNEMVVPDYQEYTSKIESIRMAFHCAISLNYMADWAFHTHEPYIKSKFSYIDTKNQKQPASNAKTFANALEQIEPDFALIRGVANTAKHLKLSTIRPHPNAPSHAANTSSKGVGWGVGPWGQGGWGTGRAQVVLAGPHGADIAFKQIADSVYKMWERLKAQHGW